MSVLSGFPGVCNRLPKLWRQFRWGLWDIQWPMAFPSNLARHGSDLPEALLRSIDEGAGISISPETIKSSWIPKQGNIVWSRQILDFYTWFLGVLGGAGNRQTYSWISKPEPVETRLELVASRAQVQGHDFFLLRRVAFSIVDGTPWRDNFCKQPQYNEAFLRSRSF